MDGDSAAHHGQVQLAAQVGDPGRDGRHAPAPQPEPLLPDLRGIGARAVDDRARHARLLRRVGYAAAPARVAVVAQPVDDDHVTRARQPERIVEERRIVRRERERHGAADDAPLRIERLDRRIHEAEVTQVPDGRGLDLDQPSAQLLRQRRWHIADRVSATWSLRTAACKLQLHSFVGRHEAERLVEPPRLGTRLVGRQLHEAAAAAARAFDRVLDHRFSQPRGPVGGVHPHALDQRAPTSLVGETGYERELQHAGHRAVPAGHHDLVVGIGGDRVERGEIRLRQRRLVALALRAQRIVGKHLHDALQVGTLGAPDGEVGQAARHGRGRVMFSPTPSSPVRSSPRLRRARKGSGLPPGVRATTGAPGAPVPGASGLRTCRAG